MPTVRMLRTVFESQIPKYSDAFPVNSILAAAGAGSAASPRLPAWIASVASNRHHPRVVRVMLLVFD